MGDRGEMLQILRYDLIAVYKCISAGYEYIADLTVGIYIGSHLSHIVGRLIIRDTHQAFAEAVPAVHGTAVGGQDQGCLRVFML